MFIDVKTEFQGHNFEDLSQKRTRLLLRLMKSDAYPFDYFFLNKAFRTFVI